MGVQVKGLPKFAARIDRFAERGEQFNKRTVESISLASKRIVVAAGQSAAPHGLHRFAQGRGAKLNARYDVKQFKYGRHTGLVVPVPPGPWYLLEKGSKRAYVILKKGAVKRAGRNRRVALARRAAAVQGQTGRGFLGGSKHGLTASGSKPYANGFAATSPVWHPTQKSRKTWSNAARTATAAAKNLQWRAARREYVRLMTGR